MHDFFITPKKIKTGKTNLNSSKASGPNCILKKCKPDLPYILAEGVLFSRLLKGLFGGPVFRNVGERFTFKNYHPVSLLSVALKVF